MWGHGRVLSSCSFPPLVDVNPKQSIQITSQIRVLIMETSTNNPSLVVTLPYHYCMKCTDVLTRWCEPVKPFDCENEGPEWLWHIGDLKESGRSCRCCKFVFETLSASPWLGPAVYDDEDLVVLRSQFVGSKHSPVAIDTPKARNWYKRLFGKGQLPIRPNYKYDKYHRPSLRVYREASRPEGEERIVPYRLNLAEDFTFILLTAPSTSSALDESQIFHGRQVGEKVDMALTQEWLRTCKANHKICAPKMRRTIPHFRLVDVKQQCVVLVGQDDKGQTDKYEYAALSYVWGNAKRLLLTAETLDQLSTPGALSLDRDHIPQTFKDALVVASQLDIKFLWIDALCVM